MYEPCILLLSNAMGSWRVACCECLSNKQNPALCIKTKNKVWSKIYMMYIVRFLYWHIWHFYCSTVEVVVLIENSKYLYHTNKVNRPKLSLY